MTEPTMSEGIDANSNEVLASKKWMRTWMGYSVVY
jgi:hypothetical protein